MPHGTMLCALLQAWVQPIAPRRVAPYNDRVSCRRSGLHYTAPREDRYHAQPEVCSVITGATSLEQMLQNVTAATWTLTQTELDAVNTILEQQGTHSER